MTQPPLPDTKQCPCTSADEARCSAEAGHEPLTADDGSIWAHGRPEFGHYWNKVSDRPGTVDTSPATPPTGNDATAPITIEISLELELAPDEVWPDGDWPTGWTAKDVMKLIKDTGTFRRFLEDWDADTFGADVTVHARDSFERGHLK